MGSLNASGAAHSYLAPNLKQEGYVGVTGRTPYKPVSDAGVQALQNLCSQPPLHGVQRVVWPGATVINIGLDGTQNNGWFPALGESPTNVFQMSQMQRDAFGEDNTLYFPGVGAPTGVPGMETPDVQASKLESTPHAAGVIAKKIVADAYDRLTARVREIHAQNPDAEISINLSGFSRGAAQAVDLANLIEERGIPGLYEPGQTRIDSMLLFDPVDMTQGALNTAWPTNVKNNLVLVALGEDRHIMPAMPVGPTARVLGIPEAAHANVGGSFNPQGIQAVTLGVALDFQRASGMAVPDAPAHLQPDWNQMQHHDSSRDNYGKRIWSRHEFGRYYEDAGRAAPSVQEAVRQRGVPPSHEAWLEKARQELGPRLQAAGFSPEMCERIITGCVCQAAGHNPVGTEAPRFLLGKDQQRLGVLHPPGVLQEMRLYDVLQDQSPTTPAVPSPERIATPVPQPVDAQTMTR